jgi:catechol 2,3-dioxygenase-like lactoylglutathione lyase family enzyme
MFAVVGVVASIQQLRGQSASPLAGATVAHVGIVVKDLDKAVRLIEQTFGVTVPPARLAPIGRLIVPADEPGGVESRVKFTAVQIGGISLEMIEPVSGHGPHADHLAKFGQGLQHVAFTVRDPTAAIDHLKAMGGKQTMSNYVDLKDLLGFTAEISGPPRHDAQ